MRKNKQVLLIVNFGFQTFVGNKKDFEKHFPSRIPTWIDFDFEITDSIQKRKKSEYDFVVFYGENHWQRNTYQPFYFVHEIQQIRCQAVLYFGTEAKVVIDYNQVYGKLFQEWPYCNFHSFLIQKDFIHNKAHSVKYLICTSHSVVFDDEDILDYDFFSNNSPTKTKTLAVVSSNADYAQGHKARIEFAHKLKEHFKDKIDFYGRGFNEFRNKYYTLSPYKYMIVLENGLQENYWTEKLKDCFLDESYPIYSGCPNISDYFDQQALSKIDINDFDAAVQIINEVIEGDYYEKNLQKIKEAKNLVLNKYNFFNSIRNYCLELEESDG